MLFFEVVNSPSFEDKIEEACKIIQSADILLVIGVGPSGAFAKYCARYFADLGFFCGWNGGFLLSCSKI